MARDQQFLAGLHAIQQVTKPRLRVKRLDGRGRGLDDVSFD
jgi:hypothetical protein